LSLPAHHRWDVSPKEAVALQRELAALVERADRLGPVARVAGVDVGFEDAGRIARAAVAVLRWPGLDPVEQAVVRAPVCFPYVPGLLSFREGPAVLAALAQLAAAPDLLLVDGQGIAHPRRCGLACHLGLAADLPAIGVAKTRLTGSHEAPGPARGSQAPLVDRDEVIGAVLRTRERVAPLYVSIGHRVSLATALHWVMACTTRYRLPETTRAAHRLASRA
jgi:deoxyribonuclease V